ncbi:MAG TPA: hypothetical protein VN736_27775, partial [Candidatus Limnocylindrales bacterium]|nr:hypothetical protein [Candidatus Limnocylindrales bacterium]
MIGRMIAPFGAMMSFALGPKFRKLRFLMFANRVRPLSTLSPVSASFNHAQIVLCVASAARVWPNVVDVHVAAAIPSSP